jgi:nicotinate-nucleotide adenylyltransferase
MQPKVQTMKRAIFGGTFDPIHSAHITVAREAADKFKLDEVLIIPAGHPPHKGASAPYEDRFRMVELACAADPRLIPSRLEEGNTKSYSILTIERAHAGFFIIGADAFAEIGSWYRSADVIRSVEFIVVTRPGHHYASPPGARVHRLESLALDVSSSDIRATLARGDAPEELPPAVAEYIHQRGLYTAS